MDPKIQKTFKLIQSEFGGMATFFRRAGRAYSRSLETLNAKVAASVVGKVRFYIVPEHFEICIDLFPQAYLQYSHSNLMLAGIFWERWVYYY